MSPSVMNVPMAFTNNSGADVAAAINVAPATSFDIESAEMQRQLRFSLTLNFSYSSSFIHVYTYEASYHPGRIFPFYATSKKYKIKNDREVSLLRQKYPSRWWCHAERSQDLISRIPHIILISPINLFFFSTISTMSREVFSNKCDCLTLDSTINAIYSYHQIEVEKRINRI